jgi:hypothetical protein
MFFVPSLGVISNVHLLYRRCKLSRFCQLNTLSIRQKIKQKVKGPLYLWKAPPIPVERDSHVRFYANSVFFISSEAMKKEQKR